MMPYKMEVTSALRMTWEKMFRVISVSETNKILPKRMHTLQAFEWFAFHPVEEVFEPEVNQREVPLCILE